MPSDTKWSQVLVQEVWFTFSWLEWIVEFPGEVRSRKEEVGPGGCAAFVSLEADGGVCVVVTCDCLKFFF